MGQYIYYLVPVILILWVVLGIAITKKKIDPPPMEQSAKARRVSRRMEVL